MLSPKLELTAEFIQEIFVFTVKCNTCVSVGGYWRREIKRKIT